MIEKVTYRIMPSGECPYGIEDVLEMKPERAFHTHLKLVKVGSNK